jgi:hypothetical protein
LAQTIPPIFRGNIAGYRGAIAVIMENSAMIDG